MFKQMSYKQVKNLFKHVYINRTSHEIYIDCSLQLEIFSKNNCLRKSDRLRLNAKPNRLFVSSANIY